MISTAICAFFSFLFFLWGFKWQGRVVEKTLSLEDSCLCWRVS
jgi:hypothetical protein